MLSVHKSGKIAIILFGYINEPPGGGGGGGWDPDYPTYPGTGESGGGESTGDGMVEPYQVEIYPLIIVSNKQVTPFGQSSSLAL